MFKAHLAFQSTPVIANGRIMILQKQVMDPLMFQSTPVIANGRIVELFHKQLGVADVSIHARYC